MRAISLPLILIIATLLAVPADAQQEAVHWHHDLESAKTVAKETRRLVLVHFWTTTCGPCVALDQNVFSQPGVAAAIEQQFVPVKLNADENSATAQWFGINRVPTDVVITPEGEVVGKLVSPPTPAAYLAEVNALATKYATRSGQAFALASSAAPVQPQINAAYASLQVAPNTQPALAPAAADPARPLAPPNLASSANFTPNPMAAAAAPSAPGLIPIPTSPAAPGFTPNNTAPFAAPGMPPTGTTINSFATQSPPTQPTITAAAAPAAASPPPLAAPANFNNPYLGAATPSASPSIAPVGVPDPRQLPPGAPPLGFDGYCPVSMRNSWKWVAGNPQFGIVHLGRTYWFAGPEEQKQFWTDPARYAPALSGMDPVLAIDHKQQIPGKREHSIDYDGLFYMFASEATLQQFTANPQRYAANVRQAMGIPRGRLVK